MRAIKVTFDTGDHLVTSINGSKDEIRAYYVGNAFNLGQGEEDKMATAVSVAFLDESEAGPDDDKEEEEENDTCEQMRSPGYAGPAPAGVSYSDWLAINNID